MVDTFQSNQPTVVAELPAAPSAGMTMSDYRLKAQLMTLGLMMWVSTAAAQAKTTPAPKGGATPAAAKDGFDFSQITQLVCDLADKLKAPELLGAAGFVIVLVFGWNKVLGEGNAFQGLKNGAIGAIIILSAGTIANAIFKGSCG